MKRNGGVRLFQLAETQLKTFSPEIIPLLQAENKLTSEYTRLIASAKIEFEGEERTLSQLQPFMEASNRDLRKKRVRHIMISWKPMRKSLIVFSMS